MILTQGHVREMAHKLIEKISPFKPDVVVYLKDGGKTLGAQMAKDLKIPLQGLDISYPLSRLLNRTPGPLRAPLWPAKEIAYRIGTPQLHEPISLPIETQRIALVDDTASSGRSLKIAIDALEYEGFSRAQIKTAVLRCSTRARPLVDYFLTDKPVLFHGR